MWRLMDVGQRYYDAENTRQLFQEIFEFLLAMGMFHRIQALLVNRKAMLNIFNIAKHAIFNQ